MELHEHRSNELRHGCDKLWWLCLQKWNRLSVCAELYWWLSLRNMSNMSKLKQKSSHDNALILLCDKWICITWASG